MRLIGRTDYYLKSNHYPSIVGTARQNQTQNTKEVNVKNTIWGDVRLMDRKT
jgi:hypothetical protein